VERHAVTTAGTPDRLVVLGSGITALAVARCAHRLGLQPVVFDTSAQVATHSRLVRTEIHPEPWCDSILAQLLQLGAEKHSYLIATADTWLQFLILYRPRLEAAYEAILHPASAVLALCLDKGKFADWCETQQLPAPQRYRLEESSRSDDDIRYPLLVRPAETLHSLPDSAALKAVEVHSREELELQLQRLTLANRHPVVCESLLRRQLIQHSVGFARQGDRMMTVVAHKLRPAPSACAPGTLVETADHPAVDALARRVAALLDYQGIGEVEILEDARSGELFLIEVNPRPWLQFSLGAATGRDLLGLVTRNQPTCTPRTGDTVRWLDLRGDLRAYLASGGGQGTPRPGLLAYLRSIISVNAFARWAWADQAPFWRDLLDMFRQRRLAARRRRTGADSARINPTVARRHAAR
jgi:predicted ATP-grasp superfamily ATP-dependent carboligase